MVNYESHDSTAIVTCASIAGVAVVLRMIARKRAEMSYGWEDCFSVLASLSFFSAMGVGIWGYGQGGWGHNPATLPPSTLRTYYKAIYIGPPLIVVSINFAKLSIACLLYRIFGVTRRFRVALYILTIYMVLVSVGTFFGLLLQCSPVSAGWDIDIRMQGAKCINPTTAARAAAVLDATSELLMCILPINVVRRLSMPLRRRIGLSFMFALGFMTAALAIARATTSTWPGAENADLTIEVLWVSIQLCVGIIVGCLPTYRKLLPEHLGAVSVFFRRQKLSVSSTLSQQGQRGQDARHAPTAVETGSMSESKVVESNESAGKEKATMPYVCELEDPHDDEMTGHRIQAEEVSRIL